MRPYDCTRPSQGSHDIGQSEHHGHEAQASEGVAKGRAGYHTVDLCAPGEKDCRPLAPIASSDDPFDPYGY